MSNAILEYQGVGVEELWL